MKNQPPIHHSGSRQVLWRLRLGFWLFQALWLSVAIGLGMDRAEAHEAQEIHEAHAAPAAQDSTLQQQAVTGQMADVGTTGVGLVLGAAEANPLGVLSLGFKLLAHQQIQRAPTVEQPHLWSAYGAMGWGAAANNMCVIAAISTGGVGAMLCPVIGLAAGLGVWSRNAADRDRATFAAICQEAKKANPQLECVYREALAHSPAAPPDP